MKMNRDHTVPLSDEAIAILEMMKPLSGNREFIFSSRIKPTQPMNSQTVNAAPRWLRRHTRITRFTFYASTALNEEGFLLMSLRQHLLM
jgi:integrase